jgi:hypothetical protein
MPGDKNSVASTHLGILGNTHVIISEYVDDYKSVPKKRHRRARIQKKWLKRWGFKMVVIRSNIYRMGSSLLMSARTYRRLVEQMQKEGV